MSDLACFSFTWPGDEQSPNLLIRTNGREFGISRTDAAELCRHISAVLHGAKESLSDDYVKLREANRNLRSAPAIRPKLDMAKLLGETPTTFHRRI